MQIFIKKLTGEILTFQVESTDSVYSLKAMIEGRTGWPIDQQALICYDKVLENKQTLADYNIQEGTIIDFIPRVRGGGSVVRTFDSEASRTDSEGPRHSFCCKCIRQFLCCS